MNEQAAEYMREHFERQKLVFQRSLGAVASMAQSNSDLIALAGINQVQSAAAREAVRNAKFQNQPPLT
jgi:hypothetical protein